MDEKKSFWEAAGRSGLILGCVPVAYMLVSMAVEKINVPVMTSLLGMILWAAKFIACIYLVRVFLKAFSASRPEAGHDDVFKFGAAMTLLSSLIYAAFYLAYVLFIQPDIFTTVAETLKESPLMDSNALSALDTMMPKMPRISFFVQFFYSLIWGLILSTIFSRNIPADNPFKDNGENNVQ